MSITKAKKGLALGKPLKVRSPLQGKSSLNAKANLAKPKKQHSITKLKKEATKYFNKYIKYRDSEWNADTRQWVFDCITCDKDVVYKYYDEAGKARFMRNAHAGHFMPETRNSTRYNELNVNGQCGQDNFNQGEQYAYAKALDIKYGKGTAEELVLLSKESHPFTVEELQQIIDDSKEQIKFYERLEV